MSVTSKVLGTTLCNIFGIDPKDVRAIRIECEAGAIATVVVERTVMTNEAEKIAAAVSTYELADKTVAP